MVWGCISHDCKLDLVTIQSNLTGDQYIRDVLKPVVVSHFDNHPLTTRPVYTDDNARPHRLKVVTAYLVPVKTIRRRFKSTRASLFGRISRILWKK
jgi:hypothetical protein